MTPFERRTEATQAALADVGADALVCVPGRTLQYLTGFDEPQRDRHLLFVVPKTGEPAAFLPELSAAQFRSETWVREIGTWADDDDPVAALSTFLDGMGVPAAAHLLVDDTMWATVLQDLRSVRPDATIGLASEVVADLRIRKDDAELDALRRASAAADDALRAVRALGSDAVGLTEAELAGRIESFLTDAGGESVSFEPIVGSGPNGAMPHHTHGDREIRAGEPVVLDFGTRIDGYPSDQTRTLVFGGDPDERVRAVHDVVRRAQEAGVEAVAPGVTAGDVDDAARSVVEDAGYGDAFVHRTGHGIGLDVHEPPNIAAGDDTELRPGMTFSVEPGIYLEDEFGVRIEDLVAVTETGCERLNHTARGWDC